MVHGPEVLSKYKIIVDRRRNELKRLYPGISLSDLGDLLSDFIHELRNCSLGQFNDWYELYK